MIVFDLKCGGGHVFEAWFGSSADYADQQARGLVSCPLCGDGAVSKAVMAPNVAAKGNAGTGPPPPAVVKAVMRELAQAQAQALSNSTWVGGDFASQARAMHLGEQDKATIHGQATRAEANALVEDGVPVAPLPFPVVPPERSN